MRTSRTILSGVTFYFGHEILIMRFHRIFFHYKRLNYF